MSETKSKVQYIDPRRLKIPPVRITTEWETDELEAFKRDVGEQGIETPLLIGKDGDNLWVIDGRHRLEEALLSGIPTVPCIVRDMNEKMMFMRNLASNRLRGKAPVNQEIRVIKELMEAHSCGVAEIQKGTGFSQERVELLMRIAESHPGILEAIDADILKLGHAEQLLRLKKTEQISFYLNICAQYRPTVRDLGNMITETLELMKRSEPTTTPPPLIKAPEIPTLACAGCDQEYPLKQLASLPICKGCFAILMRGIAEAKTSKKPEEGTGSP